MTTATTTHVSEHQYSLIRDMIKSGKSLSDIHDWNNGMSDRIHKRTLKKLYNTIARAEENELTASLARAEAAEQRVAELEEAKRWNRVTDTEPPDGVRVLMQVEAWRRGRIWQYLDDAMLVRGWKPLPPVLRSWPPPTEEGGDGS